MSVGINGQYNLTSNKEVIMFANEEQRNELEKLTRPIIKYLNDNFHPHITVVINTVGAELLEGICNYSTKDYLKD